MLDDVAPSAALPLPASRPAVGDSTFGDSAPFSVFASQSQLHGSKLQQLNGSSSYASRLDPEPAFQPSAMHRSVKVCDPSS